MRPNDIIAQRYRLERVLGEGALGVVWRGEQLGVARPVAIKVLKRVDSENDRKRFRVEANAAGNLQHHGCVAVYDFGQLEDGTPFLVMELLEGQALDSRRGERFSVQEVVHLARELAETLKYAHEHGVVHRDLKPANVFVTHDGRVKVVDFGLAKILDRGGPALTATGEFMGTPHYVSPEQARDTRTAGPPSDQYSLGVMLYEWLTGQPPFHGSPLEVLVAHTNIAAPALDRPDCPPRLAAIVHRLMQKNPTDRYPDLGSLLVALDNVWVPDDDAVTRRRKGPLRPNDSAQKQPRPWGLLLAVTAATCVVVFFAWRLSQPPIAEEPVVEQRGDLLLGNVAIVAAANTEVVVEKAPVEERHSANALPALDLRPVEPSAGCDSIESPPMKVSFDVTVDGLTRRVWVRPSVGPPRPLPALAVFTYRRRLAEQYVRMAGIDDAALEADFVLIGLEPVDSDFKQPTTSYQAFKSWEERAPPHVEPWAEPSDADFVMKALEEVGNRVCIDRNRVFAVGHAEGAAMIEQLACDDARPFPFAAIALSGSATRLDRECSVKHPVPTFRMQGAHDMFVPVNGGEGCAGTRYRSAAETDALWSKALGCSDAAAVPWEVSARCEIWHCETAPYVSCVAPGGFYLAYSFFNEPASGLLEGVTRTLGDEPPTWFDPATCPHVAELELDFAETIMPFFQHFAASVDDESVFE